MNNWFATKEFECRQCGEKFVQPLALEPTERDRQLYAQAKQIERSKAIEEAIEVVKKFEQEFCDWNSPNVFISHKGMYKVTPAYVEKWLVEELEALIKESHE